MNRAYPNRINWENEPSTDTPINETNLNKIDYAVYEIDGRVVTFDLTKANQSDLLQTVKNVTYNTETGIFTFTFWNGSTVTADLNIEKIPVSFRLTEQGVLIMTTADGTEYRCDIAALIKIYTFADSTEIDFTTTTDASGNKTITAQIKAGSITGDKLQPNYLADCVAAKNGAETAETNAHGYATNADASRLESEGFAVGEQNGEPVEEGSPYYHNNAKYYAQQSNPTRLESLSDVSMSTKKDKDLLMYDITDDKWENKQATELKLSDEKTTATGKFLTISGGKLESCLVDLEPIQSGSGTPSPTNVRPISGHTQVQVGNVGKNKLNTFVWKNTKIIDSVTVTRYDDGTYKVHGSVSSPQWLTISSNNDYNLDVNLPYGTYTISLNNYSKFRFYINDESTPRAVDYTFTGILNNMKIILLPNIAYDDVLKIQIEVGSSATEYEPYNGYTTTINLGGTRYGGILDAVSGKLTVTHKYTDITAFAMRNGSTANKMFITNPISDALKPSTNLENVYPICNRFDNSNSYEYLYGPVGEGVAINSNGMVGVAFGSTSEIDTLEKANTWLSSNPLQVVYELATPLTIQLTPQQINTLIGENHLDVPLEGQSLESLSYREMFAWDDVKDVVDTRLPISAIGTDESNNDTASKAYSQGDYFYKNGIAKAKTGIAQGATFTLNTNYEIKTLAEILKALES